MKTPCIKTRFLVVSVFTASIIFSSSTVLAWGIDSLIRKAKKDTKKVINKAKKDINGVTSSETPEQTTTPATETNDANTDQSVKPAKSGKGGDRKAFIDKRKRDRENRKNTYKICNAGKVDSEQMPPDKYQGTDKAELKKKIMDAWKTKYPNDEILAICFHAENWIRNTKAKSNATSIYVNDKSVLPVKVIVKTDEKVATIFPAYLNKDHQKNDQIKTGVATKTNAHVIKQMLIANIKK